MGKGLSALALAEVAAGGIIAWSGITDASVTAALTSILHGKPPAPGSGTQPISGTAPGATTGTGTGPTSDSGIASTAEGFAGHCYSFGGAPGASGTGCWDCSSFCNWVLGDQLGLAIPGFPAGTYRGQSHGPDTLSWLATPLCTTVGHSAAEAEPGDLAIGQLHMGICLGGSQMISAANPSLGTLVSPIAGYFNGQVLFIRRMKTEPATAPGSGTRPVA